MKESIYCERVPLLVFTSSLMAEVVGCTCKQPCEAESIVVVVRAFEKRPGVAVASRHQTAPNIRAALPEGLRAPAAWPQAGGAGRLWNQTLSSADAV